MPALVRKSRKHFGEPRSRRDYSWEGQCLGKRGYWCWTAAERACIETMEFNWVTFGRQARAPLLAYRCEFCPQWHIGHGAGPKEDAVKPRH